MVARDYISCSSNELDS